MVRLLQSTGYLWFHSTRLKITRMHIVEFKDEYSLNVFPYSIIEYSNLNQQNTWIHYKIGRQKTELQKKKSKNDSIVMFQIIFPNFTSPFCAEIQTYVESNI